MATTRPFSYNTGSSIDGTDQVGNLAVGFPTSGFSSTGLKWWNGPDEELGYVIAHQNTAGQNGADGNIAYLGFWRSEFPTDDSFIDLANKIGGQTFANGDSAKTWLNDNGYWTSWNPPGLVLLAELNAAISSSYPGTGTDWFDLINSNDGSLSEGNGTLTYGTTNGGEFYLKSGNLSNTRIVLANNADISLSTTKTKTYSVWFKTDTVGFINFSRTIMSKQSGNPASDGFWMGINSSNQLVARVTSDDGSTNKTIGGIGQTISIGTWYMATLSVKVSPEVETFKLYINTTEVGSNSGGAFSLEGNSVNDTNDLYLGNFHTGLQNAQPFEGRIGEFYIHEGDFTTTDVTSLFDNTKTRFGY